MKKHHLAMFFLLLAPAMILPGCSGSNSDAPSFQAGSHPAGWTTQHGAAFIANPSQCRECHGEDLTGGTAGAAGSSGGGSRAAVNPAPTCFSQASGATTCHGTAGPFVAHAAGWDTTHPGFALNQPGLSLAEDGDTRIFNGFKSCMPCHGTKFDSVSMPAAVEGQTLAFNELGDSCVTCHARTLGIAAPHSANATWRETTHKGTHADNAVACYQCHKNGDNSSVGDTLLDGPRTTTPGCFNNSMCHGDIRVTSVSR